MYSNASFSRYNQSTLTVFWPAYFPSINDECSRFPTLRPNKFCLYPGLLVEILSIIAKDANLTLVSKTSDNYVGHKVGIILLTLKIVFKDARVRSLSYVSANR